MIEKLKSELRSIEYAMIEMEDNDMAWSVEYTKLWREWRILKRTIKKLERIGKKYDKHQN